MGTRSPRDPPISEVERLGLRVEQLPDGVWRTNLVVDPLWDSREQPFVVSSDMAGLLSQLDSELEVSLPSHNTPVQRGHAAYPCGTRPIGDARQGLAVIFQ